VSCIASLLSVSKYPCNDSLSWTSPLGCVATAGQHAGSNSTAQLRTLHTVCYWWPLLLLCGVCVVCRYTPELSWVERCYRQASKHLHAADPHDIVVLLGAWGEMGYTPRDRLFLNQVSGASHLHQTTVQWNCGISYSTHIGVQQVPSADGTAPVLCVTGCLTFCMWLIEDMW